MNAINLITSTLALGAMMGISGTHFHQVKTMVERGPSVEVMPGSNRVDDAKPSTEPSINPSAQSLPLQLVTTPSAKKPKALPNTHSTLSKKKAALSGDARDSALMEILIAIRKDNENLRKQLSNTNRNMDELTFRVDTYSTQFRPLQTNASARPRALVVPDDEFGIPSMGGAQLLPPKQ